MSEAIQFDLFGEQQHPQAGFTPPASDPERIPQDASQPISPGTYRDLAHLTDHCHQCQRCGLATTRTHVVVSRGNPQAPLMVVGEGPGQQEDETGRPFVGKAGQLLDKILASVGFDSERDVYICNVVKCRPPGNRNPEPDEVAACKGYLLEQIRLINPKVILMTGAVALQSLLGEKNGITKVRGTWYEWQGHLCMPILHPAYLLRNQSREPGSPKWLTWQDMKTVRARIDDLLQVS
ncbi:MAG: uracil-DNA glycosylase [Gloeomargaritaceae cyanobacterium C42_A2020_066]|nr:uracil-DNA glycosylase [Gloeomargaritaceae cyanobacterium C42_A2020_066]